MHYKNGREAKNGDKIIQFAEGQLPQVGMLHSAVAGNDYCNGRLAIITPNDAYVNLKSCLHIDDVEIVEKKHEESK